MTGDERLEAELQSMLTSTWSREKYVCVPQANEAECRLCCYRKMMSLPGLVTTYAGVRTFEDDNDDMEERKRFDVSEFEKGWKGGPSKRSDASGNRNRNELGLRMTSRSSLSAIEGSVRKAG